MKILCCGFFPTLQRTLEFSALKTSEVNRARSVSISASGKATNTARVLHLLGADSTLLSFAGGANGETIQNLLEPEPFNCHWVETKTETRICQTLLSDDTGECTELVEDSPPLATAEWKAFVKAFTALEPEFDRIIFSGNLPTHAPQDIYAELLSCTDGNKAMIDASGPSLLAALEHRPAIVKINAHELRLTLKESDDIEILARELIDRGAGAVGITEGKDPAMLITPERSYAFTIPQIKAVNPIGSGDSVNAGMTFALEKGNALPEAFAFGLACGTANAMTKEPGIINPDQIAKLVPKILPLIHANEH
jgi:tagatose 6-phosphate kinase